MGPPCTEQLGFSFLTCCFAAQNFNPFLQPQKKVLIIIVRRRVALRTYSRESCPNICSFIDEFLCVLKSLIHSTSGLAHSLGEASSWRNIKLQINVETFFSVRDVSFCFLPNIVLTQPPRSPHPVVLFPSLMLSANFAGNKRLVVNFLNDFYPQ